MLRLVRKRTPLKISQTLALPIKETLQQHFLPLFNQVEKALNSWLQLKADTSPFSHFVSILEGEIYLGNKSNKMYFYLPLSKNFIEVGEVLPEGVAEGELDKFISLIEGVLFSLYPTVVLKWEEVPYISPRYYSLYREINLFTSPQSDFEACKVLEDPKTRWLLRELSKREQVLLSVLGEGEELLKLAKLVNDLEQVKLLRREFIIFCYKTGREINRVDSYLAIESANIQGFKCFYCGKPIAQERTEQLLMITDFGKRISQPSYWLTLNFLSQLKELKGEPLLGVLLEEFVPDRGAYDLCFNIGEELIFLEVKESQITLADVYLIKEKIKIYSPTKIIIYSLLELPQLCKDFLISGEAKGEFIFITQQEELSRELMKLLVEINKECVYKLFELFYPCTFINIPALLIQKYLNMDISFLTRPGPDSALPLAVPPSLVSPPPVERDKVAVVGVGGFLEDFLETEEELALQGTLAGEEKAELTLEAVVEIAMRKFLEEFNKEEIWEKGSNFWEEKFKELKEIDLKQILMVTTSEGLPVVTNGEVELDKSFEIGGKALALLKILYPLTCLLGGEAQTLTCYGSKDKYILTFNSDYLIAGYNLLEVTSEKEVPAISLSRQEAVKKLIEEVTAKPEVQGIIISSSEGFLIDKSFSTPLPFEKLSAELIELYKQAKALIQEDDIKIVSKIILPEGEIILILIATSRAVAGIIGDSTLNIKKEEEDIKAKLNLL